jgi:thiol:disulfide interchange protein DsbC
MIMNVMKKNAVFLLLFSLVLVCPVLAMPAQQGCRGSCSKCHSMTVKEANTILSGLGGEVKGVKESPVNGLWELTLERDGREAIAYMDFSKKYILPGPVFDIATGNRYGAPPLHDQVRKTDVSRIPLSNSIVMGNPAGKKKLFVFTDPDCPFCKRMHDELKRLLTMEPDLAVYVKIYPLNIHPKAYDKARVILAAGPKAQEMLDRAFSGANMPEPGPNDPARPVEESIRFADSIGVNSTPTLIFPDGSIVAGVMDAATIHLVMLKLGR